MSPTRLIILGIGFVAAILSAFLAVNFTSPEPTTVQEIVKVPTIDTTRVLVTTRTLNRGETVGADAFTWAEWPSSSINEKHITQASNPDAVKNLVGDTVRITMEQGDPVHEAKLAKPGFGFMASVLQPGMRAVSTKVSAETAAGSFILPDDRVDVMMTRSSGEEAGERTYTSVPVLRNVRVLAIDQEIQEKEGEPFVVGKTATLELTDEQVRILAVTQQASDQLTLALRSLQDADQEPTSDGLFLIGNADGSERDTITIVRYGQRTTVKTSN